MKDESRLTQGTADCITTFDTVANAGLTGVRRMKQVFRRIARSALASEHRTGVAVNSTVTTIMVLLTVDSHWSRKAVMGCKTAGRWNASSCSWIK
jgi:hypothetical protein